MLVQAVVMPVMQCSDISDHKYDIIYYVVPTTVLAALSITSFVVHFSLIRKLNLRSTMKTIQSNLNKMEICVQMILLARLFVDFTFKKVFETNDQIWIVYMFFYLFLSEFLPFFLLSLAISRQVSAYERA